MFIVDLNLFIDMNKEKKMPKLTDYVKMAADEYVRKQEAASLMRAGLRNSSRTPACRILPPQDLVAFAALCKRINERNERAPKKRISSWTGDPRRQASRRP